MRGLITRPGLVVMLLLLGVAVPASGDWRFSDVYTLDFGVYGVDGRFFDPGTDDVVVDGALAQFIVALDGAPIVDPFEHFDYDHSGGLEFGQEWDDCHSWLAAGADPAAISGGTNILCSDGALFTGEMAAEGGNVNWNYALAGYQEAPIVLGGVGCDLICLRVWDRSKEELGSGLDAWYLTDREFGTCDPAYGAGPHALDTGWCVGAGWLELGEDPLPWVWKFSGTIGVEVYLGCRDRNELDTCLAPVPEPGVVCLAVSGLVALLVRRRR